MASNMLFTQSQKIGLKASKGCWCKTALACPHVNVGPYFQCPHYMVKLSRLYYKRINNRIKMPVTMEEMDDYFGK